MPGPGNPPHRGAKKGAPKLSRVLKDMRWVYDHEDDSQDNTHGRQLCRRLLKKDEEKFMARLTAAETAHRGALARVLTPAQPGPALGGVGPLLADEGTERVEEVIRRLLEEAGA